MEDLSRCRSCNASIRWLRTAAGKFMPVDAMSADPVDTQFDHKKHISHYATCPQVADWRKKNGR